MEEALEGVVEVEQVGQSGWMEILCLVGDQFMQMGEMQVGIHVTLGLHGTVNIKEVGVEVEEYVLGANNILVRLFSIRDMCQVELGSVVMVMVDQHTDIMVKHVVAMENGQVLLASVMMDMSGMTASFPAIGIQHVEDTETAMI